MKNETVLNFIGKNMGCKEMNPTNACIHIYGKLCLMHSRKFQQLSKTETIFNVRYLKYLIRYEFFENLTLT